MTVDEGRELNRELLRGVPSARLWLLGTVAAGILAAVVTIAQMALLSHVVARVFLGHDDLARVARLLWLLLGVVAARAALVWLREVTAQEVAIRVKTAVRGRLFAHILRLGPAYTRGERTGELTASAVEGVERLDAYAARYLPQVFLSAGVPLLIAAYILPLDWASGVLLLVTGPIIPLLMILVGSYAQEHTRRQWLALSRMSAHFLDTVQGLPTLMLFGRGADERGRIGRVGEEYRARTMKVLRYAFLSGMVLELMSAIAIALVAVTLGIRLLNGGIAFERAFLVLLLAPEFYRPLRDLGAHHHAGMEGRAAAERIMQILATPHPPFQGAGWAVDAAASTAQRTSPSRGEGGQEGREGWRAPLAARTLPADLSDLLTVELADVTYTYPNAERPALTDVRLTLPAGTCTALVGRSGAGKSTLANLLLRFMEPQSGAISANGVPITLLPVEAWRQYVALVPQRPYLFHGSVRNNIRLARPDAGDDAVARAAELAGAAGFISQMAGGYEAQVGEGGARLSAGQVQRIAIARAFLKDAPLLVLDEPTSSLDPESEALIAGALDRLAHGRTVLVIAHRRRTIERADRIAVLDGGRMVEAGTHGELLRRGGAYARLMGTHEEALAPV